jgi:2-methylisocitrate lyase-like PEP mutase family enzyme
VAQAQNLDEALDALAKSMDYTIERVTADRESTADAIFLAGLLGLDPALIESAWQWIR